MWKYSFEISFQVLQTECNDFYYAALKDNNVMLIIK